VESDYIFAFENNSRACYICFCYVPRRVDNLFGDVVKSTDQTHLGSLDWFAGHSLSCSFFSMGVYQTNGLPKHISLADYAKSCENYGEQPGSRAFGSVCVLGSARELYPSTKGSGS